MPPNLMSDSPSTQADPIPQALRRLAWLLDESIPLPGGFRIGVDGLIGLIPVVGDVIGAVLSGGLMVEARRLGAPWSVLARMSFNVTLEALVGMVPFVGDLFDLGFKANIRNLRILADWLEAPDKAGRDSVRHLVLAVLFVLGAVAALGAGLVMTITALFGLVGGG